MTSLADRISTMITPTVEDMGFDVVRVQITGQRRIRLQVMAERRDGRAMHVDDCAAISRAVSALLDVEDPIPDAYTLEVSSPGLDRPLTRPGDFQRFAGLEARVELSHPLDGRKRFQGRLVGLEDSTVRIMMDGVPVDLPYRDISRAKLVLTDDLLAAVEDQRQE